MTPSGRDSITCGTTVLRFSQGKNLRYSFFESAGTCVSDNKAMRTGFAASGASWPTATVRLARASRARALAELPRNFLRLTGWWKIPGIMKLSLNSERLRIQNARRARFICAQARAADQFLSGIMQSESSSLFGSFEIYKWTNKFCPVLQSSSVSITSSAVQYSQVQSNEK